MTGEPPAPGPVGREFFDRPTVRVARDLLGCRFSVRAPGGPATVRLVETEAYVTGDAASHAFRGRTERNRSMFERPGTLYVYRIHQVVCANLVTRPGEAVLLRAGEPVSLGLANASGPGRLCRALGITLADDGATVGRRGRFTVERIVGPRGPVAAAPRVGISRATARPLRFALIDSRAVSRPWPWRTRPYRSFAHS